MYANNNKSSSFQVFHWLITVFLRVSNPFIKVFKDKNSDFIDRHIFYSPGNIYDMHYYIYGENRVKKLKKIL